METYLVIITTVLVVTQIIRVVQNGINLYRTTKEIHEKFDWIEKNDVSEVDFKVQREVFYLLKKYLEEKNDSSTI